MPGIEVGLEGFIRDLDDVLKNDKKRRRSLHEKVSVAIQQHTRSEITSSGVNDSRGKVRGWQEKYVGSQGGYAAVRPVAGGQRGKNPGAITNYLEHGHKVREKKRYSKRAQAALSSGKRVKGYYFYQAAKPKAQSVAVEAANEYADEIAGKLGG